MKALNYLQTEFKVKQARLCALDHGVVLYQKHENTENEDKIPKLVLAFDSTKPMKYL